MAPARTRRWVGRTAPPTPQQEQASRAAWEAWQQGLTLPITLLSEPPPLRMLLVLDNRAGHRSAALVLWLFRHGVMPLYTPVGGSWLNRAESIRRVLKRRALCGQQPTEPQQIIAWFGAAAAHSNRDPTSFAWGGKRAARRQRQRERHRVGGLGAVTRRPINRRAKPAYPDAQHK